MKLAILVLAAALGSASPTRRQNSTQGLDGQNACDCSEPFKTYDALISEDCPDGYEDISLFTYPICAQINCSEDDYKAQCSARAEEATPEVQEATPEAQETIPEAQETTPEAQEANPIAVVGKPTDEPAASSEQKACDCSEPFKTYDAVISEDCPDGYEDISMWTIPVCAQINCSEDDYEAQCGAKQH